MGDGDVVLLTQRVPFPGGIKGSGEFFNKCFLHIRKTALSLGQVPGKQGAGKARQISEEELILGKVVRILQFGAFVELAPGKDGMVHISKLANRRVEKVEDVINIGDMIWVKVTDIDEKGRVNLSYKDALREIEQKKANGEIVK